MGEPKIEDRLIDLEKKSAFIDQSVEDILEILSDQRQQIKRLTEELQRIQNHLIDEHHQNKPDPDERPPHY